ncbi:MAG: septum formation initiator family protein [Pseudomonadota bacterium]
MKILLNGILRFGPLSILLLALASGGLLVGEKGLARKEELEEKRMVLLKENAGLVEEIRGLERKITLLRTDLRAIEKAAKNKLGMARQDETVYLFETKTDRKGHRLNPTLENRCNVP